VSHQAWSRRLWVVGVVLMFAGLVDPLEGSIVIALGTGCVALAARLGHSAQRRWAYGGLLLVVLGVGAMWALSAVGGVGGSGGQPWWWGLPMVLYPVGWVVSLVAVVRMRRERPAPQPSA
jgi:hypothetical protein